MTDMNGSRPVVLIIGAGPAGLTAALELLRNGNARPVVLEASNEIGGISRTVVYKGNRMDIGGHRFFSKSDWVMDWWREILPPVAGSGGAEITYRGRRRTIQPDCDRRSEEEGEKTMLLRDRLSRIYFLRKYFDYPIKLNPNTFRNLGLLRLVRIGLSYARVCVFPRKQERTLEDFLINRFGDELYRTFFKDYTEKVWGTSCDRISAEWGAQRIKGLSIIEAIKHALRKGPATKTSLIEQFLYPRLGPGQLWEEVAARVQAEGGEIRMAHKACGVRIDGGRASAVCVEQSDGRREWLRADYVISTMPIKDLVAGIDPPPPDHVARIADELPYRDFITVGLLVKRMRANVQSRSELVNNMPPDNWIYVQERDVRIGRLQIFNNWSPDLVDQPDCVWLGLEYFCQEGDDLWLMSDREMLDFAANELAKIGMIDVVDVIDGTVIRVPKTYPAYFGAYAEFPALRKWLDEIPNLFLVGRNGMHRYNNQDHSMLTAKLAVEAIVGGSCDKAALWAVNVDDDYHEERTG